MAEKPVAQAEGLPHCCGDAALWGGHSWPPPSRRLCPGSQARLVLPALRTGWRFGWDRTRERQTSSRVG